MSQNTAPTLSTSTWSEVNMPAYKPIIPGERFGKWTVIASHTSDEKKCECRCDCGVVRLVFPATLRDGRSQSCGCSKPGHSVKHTKAFAAWRNMIGRCTKPHWGFWKDYGGRGITVDEKWLKFENFFADMGDPSPELSLERLDNSKGYTKSNCVWANNKVQSRNRRANKKITFQGETYCVAEWAEKIGIPKSTLRKRLSEGWTIEQALTASRKKNQYA
jgi:hypothetical protein